MHDTKEAAFLRSIAEDDTDSSARLVFADWLDDRGESARAEFLRVQCELASSDVPDKRRHALRLRERELLDVHRQAWCDSFGLSLEDVCFERGLIGKMRLGQWDGGKLLDAVCSSKFATLTELDLSGLQLGDNGLDTFAEKASFPALRKLILSENGITNLGATALASAKGLPRLDTVYLFQNSVTDSAQTALERSSGFRLTNLDLGERVEGYAMSKGEVEMARRKFIRTELWPVVSRYFQTYERLQSAMLCVAQYWDDEASDAVHGTLIVSELFEPTLKGVGWGDDPSVDPNLPNTFIKRPYGEGSSSEVDLWDVVSWEDNNDAIPLWAAFAHEGGNQNYSLDQNYAPAVMFYRNGGHEILPMTRPHLDGISPGWGSAN